MSLAGWGTIDSSTMTENPDTGLSEYSGTSSVVSFDTISPGNYILCLDNGSGAYSAFHDVTLILQAVSLADQSFTRFTGQ